MPSTKRISPLFLILISAFLAACAKPSTSEDLMPNAKSVCTGATLLASYIVKFKTGEFKTYYFSDREEFKRQIVEPNLEKIDYIEFNQRFDLAPKENFAVRSAGRFEPTMIDNWGLRMIGAPAAWQNGIYGAGVTVAVVDSGVDINHNLLRNQIAYNAGESGYDTQGRDKRSNGVDDDGNGYVDDYAGYDFVNNRGAMSDTVNHGTHVAGIIAAEHSSTTVSNSSVQGLAPRAKILPVRFLDSRGGTLDGALNSIEFARRRGVQIINASWGGEGCSRALLDKVKQVTDDGIIFIAAAGNNGSNLDIFPEFPAAFRFPLQITVGSSGTQDLMSNFSNYSRTFVDVFAPGLNIFSTLPGNSVGPESGTSMAAPFVAAAAALLYSAKPSATPSDVVGALYNSVDRNPDFLNRTQGRLNVGRALQILGSQSLH